MAIPVVRYDLRTAPFAPTSHAEMYAAFLEQVAWADANGFAVVSLAEHHGTDDGFLPAPLVAAAAVAARTSRAGITLAALLAPLHDPVRLAEEIAVLDHISGGRVSYVLGAGYRLEEFVMAGIDPKQRGRMLEEWVDVMRKAWIGESFDYGGRTIRVTPRPLTQPHPLLFLGGSSKAAARRAARLGVSFLPALDDPALRETFEATLAECGTSGFYLAPSGPGYLHVTDDPEKAWAELGPYLLYDAQTYAAWQAGGTRSHVLSQASTVDALKEEGVYRIVTPDECVALAAELPVTGSLIFHPLIGGMPPEWGQSSLELFASQVFPRI